MGWPSVEIVVARAESVATREDQVGAGDSARAF
jgi:hypothetical protein